MTARRPAEPGGPVLRALIGAWSERWHALTTAAETVADPAERARLLAVAEGVEACDMDARRAARGAGGWPA